MHGETSGFTVVVFNVSNLVIYLVEHIYSGTDWTLIPETADHLFHFNLDTHSGNNWTPIPFLADYFLFFRNK